MENESLSTLWRTFRHLIKLDPDVVNAACLTPHFWAVEGKRTTAESIIQDRQELFTYRNQVIATRLPPWLLFFGVKLTEGWFHLRPRALWRLIFEKDRRLRKLLRQYISVGSSVRRAEWREFFERASFAVVPSPRFLATPSIRGERSERRGLELVARRPGCGSLVRADPKGDARRGSSSPLQTSVHPGKFVLKLGSMWCDHASSGGHRSALAGGRPFERPRR